MKDPGYERKPVLVRTPKELANCIKGTYTFTCTGQSIAKITYSQLAGSEEDERAQLVQINTVISILQSLGVLRCYGALEIRTDDTESPIFFHLDAMDELLEKAVNRTLTNVFANVWAFKSAWPDSCFWMRCEIARVITVTPKLQLATTSVRRHHRLLAAA
jgi:hypothetical protein